MERLAAFVSSRGLLKSCPCRNQAPASGSACVDADLVEGLRPGDAVYVCTDGLVNFAENVFARAGHPFMLVSGDSDAAVDGPLLHHAAIRAMLEDGRLLLWHAQNLAASHPKLHPLPIGLDYHTMLEKPGHWAQSAATPLAQERNLTGILAASPPFERRYVAAYCNAHHNVNSRPRLDCLERVDRSVCFFEPHPLPRNATWARQAEWMFTLSPEGVGLDCHRTWETLALGSIPIVRRTPLAPLFDGLPVLVVDDWSQVNRPLLDTCAQAFLGRSFDFSPLFREHWTARTTGRPPLCLPPMTLNDFRASLTRATA